MEGKNLNALAKDDSADNHSFSIHKGLFQQIWAANDIRTFVRLMVQRNIEIQLQALDLIERRQASLQDSTDAEPEEIETAEIEKTVEAEIAINGAENQSLKKEENEEEDSEHEDKFKRLNLFFEKDRVREQDLASRQNYLRQQRDKILEIKKQARARQLNEAKDRPTSARAAQKIIDGESVEPDEASVQLRKLLAQKLRDEVVNKSINETDGV
jgi:hypothetical protein